MASSVVIENVVLRGDDLNITLSPWRGMNRANNLRLLPIVLGFLVSGAMLGSRLDPGLVDILLIVLPILLGWLGFVWVTNAVFVGAYRKRYALAPIGSEPCTFTFEADGMHQVMPRGTTFFAWSAFAEVVDDAKGFRFWISPFSAVFIPTRFVTDETAQALREKIETARAEGSIRGASVFGD